uniref:HECT domain-containing protein n=1 Tax=Calcidiscus leptoporus TaxID=127549 RepID=A0A7S0JI46_9EUKA|mmetsp:Transcript_5830/g.13568  ORF Transcript_5830/g.13568 Transcript_5830/m.13568 type:complete len:605 (+) Transcript_5830:246-2060(+)
MTIFQAIRQFGAAPAVGGRDSSSDNLSSGASSSLGQRLWGDVHTVHYRLATTAEECEPDGDARLDVTASAEVEDGAAAAERTVSVRPHDAAPLLCTLGRALPEIMPSTHTSSSVLRLLWLLQALAEHWPCLFSRAELAEMGANGDAALPPSAFVNRKLNAKLLRQLQDPLALCSRSLPGWCSALTSDCGFLFNFDSRRLFLHSTAFGLSRALQRLQQHSQEGGASSVSSERSEFRLGRLPRQKVGTGLGPTLEFYTLVSLELRRSELGLWHSEEPPPSTDGEAAHSPHVHAPHGLFPRPVAQGDGSAGVPARTLGLFTFMGRFVAKAMLDNRLVDLPFSTPFYRHLLGHELGMADLLALSPQLHASLRQLHELALERNRLLRAGAPSAQVAALSLQGCAVSDLGLDFTLPGFPQVELVAGGAEVSVTLDNLSEYVQLVLQKMLLDGVRAQMDAFSKGFSEVFGAERLRAFSADELDLLFNGMRERWDRETVVEQLKFDHGYTRSSQAVSFLLDILSEFNEPQLRQFLKFVTGSPRLPVGGLARLSPRLTIVQKRPEGALSADAYLPSVMTCANYLKLPDYSSKAVMKERLLTAINEGQGCFLLS